jgi:hypothetical protein
VKATGSREPEEPRAFTDDDSHDESFRKQQEVSVVESTPPNHGGEKKRVVLQLFKNDEYASYDTEKKKRKNKTPSECTNDSEDTNNKKRKIGSSNLKKRSEVPLWKRDQLDVVRQDFVASLINTTNREKQMVLVDDIVVLSKHLQCLTHKDESEDGVWLGDEVR